MNNLRTILDSGLQFSVVDGKLKIVGDAELIERLKPLIVEHKVSIIKALSAVESIMADTKPAEAERITLKAVSAQVPGNSELSATQILEWAVEAEDQAAKHGYKFARMELQCLISAANDYECDERAKFLEIVAELRTLQAL